MRTYEQIKRQFDHLDTLRARGEELTEREWGIHNALGWVLQEYDVLVLDNGTA